MHILCCVLTANYTLLLILSYMSVCLSVYPQVSARHEVDRFFLKFDIGNFYDNTTRCVRQRKTLLQLLKRQNKRIVALPDKNREIYMELLQRGHHIVDTYPVILLKPGIW